MSRTFLRLTLTVGVVVVSGAVARAETAVLQGLDKVTGRVSTFDAPVGQAAHFGTLSIVAKTCRKRPPDEPPNTAAFVEIDDVRNDRPEPIHVFTGWMFALSPALNAMEHPVYDVWVVDCK